MDRAECEHGHLRRKCPICALEEELTAERETSERLRKEITAWRERERKTEAQIEAQRKRAEKAEAQAATLRDLLAQAEGVVCGEREDGALCGGIRAALATGAGREYMERLDKLRRALRLAIKDADGWHDNDNGGPSPNISDEMRALAQEGPSDE